jgi:hypothetical protein
MLAISMVRDQGQPWPSGGYSNLGYTITFRSLSGCACALAPDLVLTFNSDTNYGNTELDSIAAMSLIGLAGPGNPLANFYWKQLSVFPGPGIATGPFGLAPGYQVSRQVYAEVEGLHVDQTITSQAVLSSASFGIALTATVSTYIYGAQPPPTPIPTPAPPTPTPIAGLGQIAAYPQPAADSICFAYFAPGPGALDIEIYNAALQRVAHVTDQARGGQMEQACVGIAKLAPGAYYYRAKVGGFQFPPRQFGVLRP